MTTAAEPTRRQLVGTREAARRLGLHPNTVSRLARAGTIGQHVLPFDKRLRLVDLDELARVMEPRPLRREEAAVPE